MRNRRKPALLHGLLSLGAVVGVSAALAQPLPPPASPPTPQSPPDSAVRVEPLEVAAAAGAGATADAPADRAVTTGAPAADSPTEGADVAESDRGDGAPASDPGDDAATTDSGDPAAAAARAAAPLPANWLETSVAIDEYAEAGDLDAALALRERLLELAAEQFGAESSGVAEAHLKIADLHRQNGEFQRAGEEILLAIDVFMDVSGPLSAELIKPFLELGETYVEAGDFRSGISAYSEARTIGRRNFGLLNADQLEIIDAMTDAAERLGQPTEAQQLQLEALTLVERNFSEYSLEAIEARYKYAEWLRRHGLLDDERRIYYQIERAIRDEYENDPLMRIRLLRERARSFRFVDRGDGNGVGLGALNDALEILDEMPDPPPLLHAEVLVDIGDWQVEFARTRPIGDEYLRAWALLGEIEGGEELRREWFDGLVQIEMAALSRRDLTTDPDAPEGHVIVYFTVDPAGRTQEIVITDSEPPGFKDGAVQRLIREARFRPRIVDGELVPARRAYRFEFRYIAPEQ